MGGGLVVGGDGWWVSEAASVGVKEGEEGGREGGKGVASLSEGGNAGEG